MHNSISSWDSIDESIFNRKTKGVQQVKLQSGKIAKLSYKVQNNTQFIIKITGGNDMIDTNGNLTSDGARWLTNYINSQLGIVHAVGKLDTAFFKDKFIVYKVKKETDRVQKIQFNVLVRASHPNIPEDVQFVSTDQLSNIIDQDAMLRNIVNDVNKKSETEDTDASHNEPEEKEVKKEEKPVVAPTPVESVGNKFLYQMLTNSKIYLMEFTSDDAIEANTVKEDGSDGFITWEDPSIMWKVSEAKGDELNGDMEILDKTDKNFLTKMFTDENFKNKHLKEYHDKHAGSEINVDNIKKMLYYNDTKEQIFPEVVKAKSETGKADADSSGKATPDPIYKSGELLSSDDMDKRQADIHKQVNKLLQ